MMFASKPVKPRVMLFRLRLNKESPLQLPAIRNPEETKATRFYFFF